MASVQAVRTIVAQLIFSMAVSACGSGTPAGPQRAPFATASAVATIVSSGGTLSFPPAAGYGGSFVYSANNASGIVTAAIQTTTIIPPLPGPPPPGVPLVAFGFRLSDSVTFVDWYRLLTTISVPSTLTTAGHSFGEFGYDLAAGTQLGWNPGTVNGNSIIFAPGLGPVTLGNRTYTYVLVMM